MLNVNIDEDVNPEFNDITIAALIECEEIIKSGRCRFKNSAEMFESLENDVDDVDA